MSITTSATHTFYFCLSLFVKLSLLSQASQKWNMTWKSLYTNDIWLLLALNYAKLEFYTVSPQFRFSILKGILGLIHLSLLVYLYGMPVCFISGARKMNFLSSNSIRRILQDPLVFCFLSVLATRSSWWLSQCHLIFSSKLKSLVDCWTKRNE